MTLVASASSPVAVQAAPKRLHPAVVWVACAVLAVAGLASYAVFVQHVLARGDAIVDEPIQAPEAATPLASAAAGIVLLAASGIVGLGSATLRSLRLRPLAGLGLPWAGCALLAILAFVAGSTVLTVCGTIALLFLGTAALACLAPPGLGGPAGFLFASWIGVGTLVGLGLVAAVGLAVLDEARPTVPWSFLLAAAALGALVGMVARHAHRGTELLAYAPHEQARRPHTTEAIQLAAARLHGYVEEGRDGAGYTELAASLATASASAALPEVQAPPPPPSTLPGWRATLVALLRGLAFAAPVALLVQGVLGLGAALAVLGALLPFLRDALSPRKEPTGPVRWLLGGLLLGAGGWLATQELLADDPLLAHAGAAAALPWLALGAFAFRRRRPEGLAHLRVAHAERLAAKARRQAVTSAGLLVASLGLPSLLWLVAQLVGLEVPAIPLPVLAAGALSGLLALLAALLVGGTKGHRDALRAALDEQAAGRRAAHSRFLDQLELT
jgi:hypothetical protein